MQVKCACAYGNCCQSLTMRRDFEGGVYWDELADRCSEISRAVGFRGAVRFRGNTVLRLGWMHCTGLEVKTHIGSRFCCDFLCLVHTSGNNNICPPCPLTYYAMHQPPMSTCIYVPHLSLIIFTNTILYTSLSQQAPMPTYAMHQSPIAMPTYHIQVPIHGSGLAYQR